MVCTELLQDLLARGLPLDGRVLCVIDGGKGLRKALGDVLGDAAVIQRCQLHKGRNLEALVPKSRQASAPRVPGSQRGCGAPAAQRARLELQIGTRSFIRAWANTQVGVANQEPDFFQFKVTTGTASFDLRTLEPGRTVEVDTPHAGAERGGDHRGPGELARRVLRGAAARCVGPLELRAHRSLPGRGRSHRR